MNPKDRYAFHLAQCKRVEIRLSYVLASVGHHVEGYGRINGDDASAHVAVVRSEDAQFEYFCLSGRFLAALDDAYHVYQSRSSRSREHCPAPRLSNDGALHGSHGARRSCDRSILKLRVATKSRSFQWVRPTYESERPGGRCSSPFRHRATTPDRLARTCSRAG